MTNRPAPRISAWLRRWGPILPLLLAEGTIWVGFGALLPILPIYITRHGVDLPTLGLVIAAWPAARLVGEPAFGWVADRGPRKLLMVSGLLLAAVAAVLPLVFIGPLAFLVLRAVAGLAAAMYDPAARGYLVDAVPPGRQGETFGLYGSAQMGGFLIGPALGGIGAALTNNPEIVFWFAGIALAASAFLVAFRLPELAHRRHTALEAAAEPDVAVRPRRLVNVLLVAAVAFNVGSYFASGSYEVVWSLYLTSLGAGLDAIGLTFASFALPVILLSPFAGRLVDARGGYGLLVGGLVGVAVSGLLYPLVPEVWFVVVLGLFEGTAIAFASPALYALVARASPPGRSSTAQGIFGTAGTVGTIVASLTAGVLAEADLRFPFWATGIGTGAAIAIAVVIGRGKLRDAMRPRHTAAGEGGDGVDATAPDRPPDATVILAAETDV